MTDKPGMIIYFDRWEPILELDNDTVATLLRAAVSYSKTGEWPELDGITQTIFKMLRTDIDKDDESYLNRQLSGLYGVYKREANKTGEEVMCFDEWKHKYHDGSLRLHTDAYGSYPSTSTIPPTSTPTPTETSSNIIPDTTTTTTIIGSPKIEGGECIQDSDIPSPSPPSSPSWEDKKRAAIEKLFAARGGQI